MNYADSVLEELQLIDKAAFLEQEMLELPTLIADKEELISSGDLPTEAEQTAEEIDQGVTADGKHFSSKGGAGSGCNGPNCGRPEGVGKKSDDPREQAAYESGARTKNKNEFAFARESAIGNAGEDVEKSARHVRNEWKTLEQAEKDGTADELVTRDKLMRNEPKDFVSLSNEQNQQAALASYLSVKRFPPHPGIKGTTLEKAPADERYMVVMKQTGGVGRQLVLAGRQANDEMIQKYKANGYEVTSEHTAGALREQIRSEYYQNFKAINDEAIKAVQGGATTPEQVLEAVRMKAKSIYDESKARGGAALFQQNVMADYLNKGLSPRSRTGVYSDLKEFNQATKEKWGADHSMDKGSLEAVKKIAEGDSIANAFGKSKGPGKFDPTTAYDVNPERKGPALKEKTPEAQMKMLTDKVGLRAVQWGNSVTDAERAFHLQHIAGSMKDLSDVTGFDIGSISHTGKLAMAVGARGKGGAMAHYEPDLKTINLTRKSGVGSLAHEWGHSLDYNMNAATGGAAGETYIENVTRRMRMTGDPEKISGADAAVAKPMGHISNQLDKVADRIRTTQTYKDMSPKERQYWVSKKELLARAYEKHVQVKLESQGRKNTYLSGSTDHELWPTKEESAAMSPHFDEFHAQAKKGGYDKKMMALN